MLLPNASLDVSMAPRLTKIFLFSRGNKETKEGLVKEKDSTWQGIVTLIPGYRLGELFMLFHIEALGIPHNVITTIKEEFKG